MKKLQNTLYVTKRGAYLHKERETIVIEIERKKILQVPIHSISEIFCFSDVLISPALIGFCCEKGINLAFFTTNGNFLGRIQGKEKGNVLLRRSQYHINDSTKLNIARVIVAAKISSSRGILQRYQRNYVEHADITSVINKLKFSIINAKQAVNIAQLRGIEGEAAANYFKVFSHLINPSLQMDFPFNGRNRRPPKDLVNALLSFIYAIIGQNITGALSSVGLDSQVGFLHFDRPGRDSLAQDLLEEFRAWLCDRLAINLINRKQIKKNDFIIEASGAVRLKDEGRKIIFEAIQTKKQEIITHPFLGEKVEIGLIPYIQATLLARHLRGDLAYYPPFYMR